MFIAISAAGAFRTDDGVKLDADWQGTARSHPRRTRRSTAARPSVLGMHPSRPNVLFMQKHWDVMRSDNAGDLDEVSGNLPTDFGFVLDMHAHGRSHLRGADQERLRALSARRKAARLPQPQRKRMGGAVGRSAAGELLREHSARRDAVDAHSCGIYFQASWRRCGSANAGDGWSAIVRDLPPVLSVEVQTLK